MQNYFFKLGVITLAASVLFSACLNISNTLTEDEMSQQASVAEITNNFNSFRGKTVSVRNDIQELLGEAAFILDKDRLFDGETILVIDVSQTLLTLPNGEGTEVWVKGRVVQFVLTEIEQEHGLDLDPNLYAKYEGKPAIIAQSVILSPDPNDITRNPEAYYHKLLAVEGEVEDINSSGIFELDEEQLFGGKDLLVVKAKPEIEIQDEQTVLVTGILRPFIAAEFERDYNLNWDLSLQQQIEAEYFEQPALVAEKVALVAK
jgi:hypothetical protein